MKTIKFRRPFYNDITGKFSHFSIWGVNIDRASFISPGSNNKSTLKEDEMFTGLLDKLGTDIYEGDIVIIPENIYPQPFEVRYFVSSFDILCVPTGVHIPLSTLCEYEVIGNIHQNPELLNI